MLYPGGQRAPHIPENFHTKKKQMMDILELIRGITIKQSFTKKILFPVSTEVRRVGRSRGRSRGRGRGGTTQQQKEQTVTEVREDLVNDGKRKTCVVGFYTTVHSIFDLAQEPFEDKDNKCDRIYTYYLLQDFGRIIVRLIVRLRV